MTMTTYAQVGIREDLSDEIYDISPQETPVLSTIKKGAAAKNRYIEWQTDALANPTVNARIEGAAINAQTATASVRLRNYTQIFAKSISVSDTANAVTTAGRREELGYQIAKRAAEMKRDQEFALCGNYASSAGAANTARRMAGIESWIKTNGSRGSGGSDGGFNTGTNIVDAATDASATNLRTFVEADVKLAVRQAWTAGGNPDLIQVGGRNKQKFSGFAGIAQLTNEVSNKTSEAAKATIIAAADFYKSDFGVHKVVAGRFNRDRTALILDTSYWSVHYLIPYNIKKLGIKGLSEERLLNCEMTCASRNEGASASVADLLTT